MGINTGGGYTEVIASIGDIIDFTDHRRTLQSRVKDVAFICNGEVSSLKNGGELCYFTDKGWIPHRIVVDIMESEDCGDDPKPMCNTDIMPWEQTGLDIMAWKDNLPDRPDNSLMPVIVSLLMSLQWDKEGTYGSSWRGKGEYRGIMANIDRKYDRLDKITNDEINSVRPLLPTQTLDNLTGDEIASIGESKIDAVADLANYCILYMTYLMVKYPGAFQVWVNRNIPQYLREKIPFLG